jgi:A/G-specific adenine glycosylase
MAATSARHGGDPAAIATPLAAWFRRSRRDLPWRGTRDPYAIWLSEVMLQQTRVAVAIPYYERFLARFPAVRDLAAAGEEEVLGLWAGLGYYSRGRNLLRAARTVVERHGGAFPRTLAELRALPGVGEYTAAAVGSIAFGIPAPVVDGNVVRLLARHGAIRGDPSRGAPRRAVHEAAARALARRAPGDHNQAMMELGATVCLPRAPRCGECPLGGSCRARALGDPEAFPPPRARRAPETQYWVAAVVGDAERVWIVPRGGDEELLPGHRGVPLVRVEGTAPPSAARCRAAAAAALRELGGLAPRGGIPLPPIAHSITHRRLRVHPVRFPGDLAAAGGEALPPEGADRLAALFRKVLRAAFAPPVVPS